MTSQNKLAVAPTRPALPRGTAWLVSPTFLFVSLAGSIGLFIGAVMGGSSSGSAVWGAVAVVNAVMLYVAVRRAGPR